MFEKHAFFAGLVDATIQRTRLSPNTVRLAVRWRLKPLLYKQSPPTRTNIRA
jgi:hypothetical protein